nr:uncharacterized protein LOC131781536 [Pocillopora verrucosa]
MATSSSVIILVFTMVILSCGRAQEILKIWRDSTVSNDDITVPDSQCNRTQQQCDRYNAKHLTECLCYCEERGGQETAFWEPSSTCIPVSSLRQQSECQLLFTDERAEERLKFFPSKTSLEKEVAVPANRSCAFYYGDKFFVQYLGCEGSWKPITAQNVLNTIELTPSWSTTVLKIRIKAGSTLFANLTAGHLVRVPIQCRRENSEDDLSSSCIVFMGEGTVECPYPRPTLAPGFNQATLPAPVLERLNSTATLPTVKTTTSKTVTMAETTRGPSPTKETTQPRQTEKATTEPTTSQSARTMPPQTEQPSQGETAQRTQSKKNTYIIAGSVAGGILLIALILLILWRCNSPKKQPNSHRRLEGSITSPVSHMSRHSIPVYSDASYLSPLGTFDERTRSLDNPVYRGGSEGLFVSGLDMKRGSIYSDHYPTNPPPRPPPGSSKRGSMNGQVNPALALREEYVTMNPLYEGQVMHHKDLEELNCSDFGVSADQVVLDTRKDPEEFNDDTYDCPGDILNSRSEARASPIPVFYALDESYPDSISNTFHRDSTFRGRPDGRVYDEPEGDLRRSPYIVMDNQRGVIYSHDYDEPPRDEELLSIRRLSSPTHGILKTGNGSPSTKYLPRSGH